ncbi:thiol:disulfide interchange protein DsbA/DsbL [Hahella sp. SMD15-11]|uniref:Thiol:disulfide interchange protein n=1 Tax=Thermohahella caldifontis TaxID=3142973 RepID=A0AB39UVX7_9GAMM
MKNWFLALSLIFALVPGVQAANYVAGQHYQVLPAPVPTEDPSRVEVVELFWYGCPHCYRFDPLVHAWKKKLPEHAYFKAIPMAFNAQWAFHAQTYYALKAIGWEEKVHQAVFDALARDHKPLLDLDSMASFLAGLGVPEEEFRKAMNSFAVKGQVNKSRKLGTDYHADGVPALVVNGKYLITTSGAGDFLTMLRIADFLIEKEKASLR